MFQNNIQEISRNWKEIFKFYSSGYYKMFKMKNGCQNMHPTEIWNIWSKAECTHRGAKKCKFGDEHKIFVEQLTWK